MYFKFGYLHFKVIAPKLSVEVRFAYKIHLVISLVDKTREVNQAWLCLTDLKRLMQTLGNFSSQCIHAVVSLTFEAYGASFIARNTTYHA